MTNTYKKILSLIMIMCMLLQIIALTGTAYAAGYTPVPSAGAKDDFTGSHTSHTKDSSVLNTKYISSASSEIYYVYGNFWDSIGFNCAHHPQPGPKYVTHGVVRGSNLEQYIMYDLSQVTDLSKLTVEASMFYLYEGGYCGTPDRSGARAHLETQLQYEGIKFYTCKADGTPIAQISLSEGSGMQFNLTADKDLYGSDKNEVIYTLNGGEFDGNTKFLKVVFPDITAARAQFGDKIRDVTAMLDYVDFIIDGVSHPDPTITPTTTPEVSASPTVSPTPSSAPTPTPSPSPRPSKDPNAPEFLPLGLGASFTLYPSDYESITPSEGIMLGDWGKVIGEDGNMRKGPFSAYDTAVFMNGKNGTADIHVAEGGNIESSNNAACFSRYDIQVNGGEGTSVVYTPAKGLLKGVDAKIMVPFTYSGGSKSGIDAIVKYNDGETETVIVVPDGPKVHKTPYMELIDVGVFTDIESVTIRTRGKDRTYLPSVAFKVVNENPGTQAPDLPYKKYIKPDVTPAAPAEVQVIPTVNTESPVSINEVCSSNTMGITDYEREYCDWIELYNSSDSDINIEGYGLTDKISSPLKWVFPSAIVPAKGYLTVFASGKSKVMKNGEIHTSFSVAKEGETLMLSDREEGIISVMDVPALGDDTTMGRYPDGSGNLKIMSPTAGGPNGEGTVISTFVPKPEFSAESGFYDSNFDLTLSSQGGKIYYTLDGSTPTASSNEYAAPLNVENCTYKENIFSKIVYPTNTYVPQISVDKSMIVRAAVIDDYGNSSAVVTKTYFVGYDMAEDFNNTSVVSVVTDGDNLFDEETGIFYNYDKEGKEWEREAHLAMFERDGKLVIDQNIGIRVRGFMSKEHPQKGINLYARSEYGNSRFEYPIWDGLTSKADGSPIESFKSVCLRNGGQRYSDAKYVDGAAQNLALGMGMPVQASRPSVVFINGECWGVYYLQERVSVDYVEEHYGVPDEDVVLIKNHEEKGSTTPAEQADYVTERGWLNTTDFSIEENYNQLLAKYDMQNMLYFYALNLAMTNRDWENYNLAIWRSRTKTDAPYQDGKWRFLLYDCDMCYDSEKDNVVADGLAHPWAKAMLSNPTLRLKLINAMCDVFSSYYAPQAVFNEFQYWYDEALPIMNKFYDRFGGSIDSYKNQIGSWYTRIIGRDVYYPIFMKQALGLTGDYAHLNVRVSDSTAGTVYVNSIKPDFKIGSYSGRYFTDVPATLVAVPYEGYKFAGWVATEGTGLSSGTEEEVQVTVSATGSRVTALFEVDSDVQGTAANPFKISDADDLRKMAEDVNSGVNCDKYYVLENNIVLSGTSNFTAIGNRTNPFTGSFDGGFNTISGINIASNDVQGQGLFGYVGAGGTVKNIAVTDITVVSTGTDGKNVGGIVGNNGGTIENCYSTGLLSGVSTVGGITGNNKGGTVQNCYSIATVNSGSPNSLGGVAGKTESAGRIINCYSLIAPVGKIESDGTVDERTSAKTAEEFADGTVTELLNQTASIWITGEVSPVFAGTKKVTLSFEDGKIKISTDIALSNAKLVVASYDNELLTAIKILNISAEADTFLTEDIPEETSGQLKLMLFKDVNNVMPLAKYIEN